MFAKPEEAPTQPRPEGWRLGNARYANTGTDEASAAPRCSRRRAPPPHNFCGERPEEPVGSPNPRGGNPQPSSTRRQARTRLTERMLPRRLFTESWGTSLPGAGRPDGPLAVRGEGRPRPRRLTRAAAAEPSA